MPSVSCLTGFTVKDAILAFNSLKNMYCTLLQENRKPPCMRLAHLDENGRSSVSMISGHVSVWPCGIDGAVVQIVQCILCDLRF